MNELRNKLRETIFAVAYAAGNKAIVKKTDASSVYEPDIDKVIDAILQALPEEVSMETPWHETLLQKEHRHARNETLEQVRNILLEAKQS